MKQKTIAKHATETPHPYPTPEAKELFEAILLLKNSQEAALFFRDLLTIAEIKEFANRWQMVKMLAAGNSYTSIAAKLNVSTATVTRVAHWLYDGMGGYKLVASRLPSKRPTKQFKLRGKRTWL